MYTTLYIGTEKKQQFCIYLKINGKTGLDGNSSPMAQVSRDDLYAIVYNTYT